ncbi:MAG: hypothetical protein GC168_01000 [Candidatus Hydrogenedens sp.]|nr:hypothetical protein [Candidatus Hydrogenedens sp.]
MKQFVTCEVDGCALCVPIGAIQEVHGIREITPVRRAPEYVAGLLNLRGHVITMIDLGARIGTERGTGPREQNIVLKPLEALRRAGLVSDQVDPELQQDVIGLAVDAVGDVIEAEEDVMEATPANLSGLQAEFFGGVVRLDNCVYPIVDVSRVIRIDQAACAA